MQALTKEGAGAGETLQPWSICVPLQVSRRPCALGDRGEYRRRKETQLCSETTGIHGTHPRLRRQSPPLSIVAGVVMTTIATAEHREEGGRWVGTWSASPQLAAAPIPINGQTLRQIVHTSLGGDREPVRFSNAYGTSDLVIGSAHVALSAGGSAILPGTDRMLRFNGSTTVTIPAGALVVSDQATLDVPALGDLAVSLYLPGNTAATTRHDIGLQTNYISTPGDFTGATAFAGTTTQSFYFLTAVDVRASATARAIVTLGDSITDGFASTPDMNQRWPNLLAERLQSRHAHRAWRCSTPASAATEFCTTSWARAPWPGSTAMCSCRAGATVPDRAARQHRHPDSRPDREPHAKRDGRADYSRPAPDHQSRPCHGPAGLRRHLESR